MVKATADEILQCQFSKWYHVFERDTIKSKIVELNQEFVVYLKEDGVILPKSVQMPRGMDDQLSDDEDVTEVSDEDSYGENEWDFTSINVEMQNALECLKGEVFIKLNWSAPSDASWMMGGNVKCKSLSDIYLLLKSSDRVMFDLEKMFDDCENPLQTAPETYTLVIRKWANLIPSMEFRVFVSGKQIIGMCQRDSSTYYPFLAFEKAKISQAVRKFFGEVIQTSFPLDSYTVDLYIDKKGRVWIIDFNVFGSPTSAVLFDWEELVINALYRRKTQSQVAVSSDSSSDSDSDSNSDSYSNRYSNSNNNINTSNDNHIYNFTGTATGKPACQGSALVVEDAVDADSTTVNATDFCIEFRLVNSITEELPSSAGAYRGPIDVHMSSDFPKFFDICKQQNKHADT
jgi:hypothetical protein